MERSQSLPLGYFIAGICFACFCALSLITVYFYTQGQHGTGQHGTGQHSQIPLNPRVESPARPLSSAKRTPDSSEELLSLAGYNRSVDDMPQKSVDLIKAARNISGTSGNHLRSSNPGSVGRLSDDPSPDFVSGRPTRIPVDRILDQRAMLSTPANADEFEADRQWLLSLEMHETPESPPLTSELDVMMDLSMQSFTMTEVNKTADAWNLTNALAEAVDFCAPRERPETQAEPKTDLPAVAKKTESVPAESVQELTQGPPASSVTKPYSGRQAPVALHDNSLQFDAGPKTSLSAELDLFPPAVDRSTGDSHLQEPVSAGKVDAPHTGKPEDSDSVNQPTRDSVPATASIGDQLPEARVFTLADQPRLAEPAPATDDQQDDRASFARNQESQIIGWPIPTSLMKELDEWKSITLTSQWAAAMESTIIQLNNTRIDDSQSYSHIEYCDQLADQLLQHAQTLPQGQALLSSQMHRFSWRMKRRFAIWMAVHQLARVQLVQQVNIDASRVAVLVDQRRISFDSSNVPGEWVEYLMLDRVAEVFNSSRATDLHRQTTARKIMSRVTSTALTDEQILYAQRLIGDALGSSLRDTASGKVDLGQFLIDLESMEEGSSAIADALVNNHFQNFYWSRDGSVQQLAAVFDENYRNANFQIEISERLINSVLPRNMTINEPVQDRILGAQVFGNSRVQNQISVELIPDSNRLSFRMISNGSVLSRTRAHASGFVFNSLGNAMVNASKGVSIGPEGVFTLPADVEADAQSKLLNVRSRMDNVPLVGWMARHVAEQKQQQQSQQANMIVEQKLRNEFGSRVDQEIQAHVDQGRAWVLQNVVDPFNALELEPMIANMHTTENAAVVRYRLAGLDQNAANSIRPQSLPGSLVGVQIHESAINNIINRIDINGKTFTAPEFMHHVSTMLGRADVELNEGEYDDVKFQFASRDALRFDFDDDRVAITLRLKRLQIGRSGLWKNLIVTAWYRPHATGLNVDMILDMDKGVSLSGTDLSFGDQLAVRTVFNALFKPNFEFPLLPVELAQRPATHGVGVSQIVLVDGWVGLSFADFRPNRQSQSNQPATHRNARILQNRWR